MKMANNPFASRPAAWVAGITLFLCAMHVVYSYQHKHEHTNGLGHAYSVIFNTGFWMLVLSNVSLWLYYKYRNPSLSYLFLITSVLSALINALFIIPPLFGENPVYPASLMDCFWYLPLLSNVVVFLIYIGANPVRK